ncbi:hypothetical protein J4Q44_G00375990 [Coregonus suidteri]|uniref:G-protein coupled receptors family 1 profile domain-containing protein n=1 Tax=Coregonus suidteri TaxID=861788 RepID=A0AAN8Q4W5_9TELE
MCTGKCSKVIAIPLYILAGVSIICNIIAFFPGWKTNYAEEEREGKGDRITDEVKYMGGFIGGGLMMFLSIGFAAAGVVGALYSLATSALVLANGPVCLFLAPGETVPNWGRPFMNNSGNYLGDSELWKTCKEPEDVVQFNIGLFATLLVAASLELVLCGIQMVNGLFGCICGTCGGKEELYLELKTIAIKIPTHKHQTETTKKVAMTINTTHNCTEPQTLVVFFCYTKSWSHTTVYMINLAIADLLLVPDSALRIYYHLGMHGLSQVLCEGVGLVLLVNMYGSIFLLTCMCFDRCVAVCFPMSCRVREGRKKAPLVCLGVWGLTIGASLPIYISKRSKASKEIQVEPLFRELSGLRHTDHGGRLDTNPSASASPWW